MITSRRMADTDVLPPKAGAYLFMILQVAGFDVDRDVGGPRRVSGATLLTRLHETMDAILFKNRVEIHSFFDTCAEDRPPGPMLLTFATSTAFSVSVSASHSSKMWMMRATDSSTSWRGCWVDRDNRHVQRGRLTAMGLMVNID